MIKLVHVVAISQNHCIGKDNALLWHIPADLQHFKNITSGGHIIMGRKTFESLGRLLPKRTHYVITQDKHWKADGVFIFHDIQSAIDTAKINAGNQGQDKVFIIGGGEIYKQTIHQADTLEITHVNILKDGDTFYPDIPDDFKEIWRSDMQIDEKSGLGFYFTRYEK